MADPVTNNASLTLPQVGGDIGSWGTVLNNGVITALDGVLGASLGVTITSVDVTLTTTQAQSAVFAVTGGLTGNRNLILPLSSNSATAAVGGKFVVVNNCTGSFNLTVKTAASGSVGVVVPQTQVASLYSDTTNVNYVDTGNPATVPAVSGNPTGQLAGTAGSVNSNASLAADYTNGVAYLCTATGTAGGAVWKSTAGTPAYQTATNLQLNATAAGNILTVALKAANTGNDPAVGNPVTVQFRDATAANGDPVTLSITSALSVATVVGATLGTQSNVPFRFWVVIFNNAGTPYLALINCLSVPNVFALNEAFLTSSVAMSAGATSAGVFYTPAGITLGTKALRILGWLEYANGLVTPGTYNNPPTQIQIFGPGDRKPGDVVQIQQNYTSAVATGTNAFGISNSVPTNTAGTQFMVQSISPTDACNMLRIDHLGYYADDGGGVNAGLALFQDGTVNAIASVLWGSPLSNTAGNSDLAVPVPLTWHMVANTTSLTTFKVRVGDAAGHQITFNGSNTSPFFGGTIASHMRVTEFMG